MKSERKYIPFTEDMKNEYTILVPNMLPRHFKLFIQVLKNYGYNMELLETEGREIIDTGLKYVHNDTCYPAILVIGQFLTALKSGKYDPHKVALILFQTGGGCRASNYIFLLRKALERAGYGYVPVISFNLGGLENHPGFKLTVPILHRMFYAIIYGDLLLTLVNQCKPYEVKKGQSEQTADRITAELARDMDENGVSMKKVKNNCKKIIAEFGKIPLERTQKVKVGVVGEIYVKYSPLGNNNLEQFLVDEGAEVVVSLFHSGVWDVALFLQAAQYGDVSTQFPISRAQIANQLNMTHKTADGRWYQLAMPQYDALYNKFVEQVLLRPDLVNDPRFYPQTNLQSNLKEFYALMVNAIGSMTGEELERRMKAADLPYAACQTWQEVLHDEQAWASNILEKVKFPNGEERAMVRTPVMFAETELPPYERGHFFGEDTREVLASLGYTEEEITAMFAAGEAADVKRIG